MRGRCRIVRAWLAVAAIALLGAPSAFASATDQAVAWQIDPAHDGLASGDAMAPPLNRIWSRGFGSNIGYPLIAGGRIFVVAAEPGGTAPELWALDERTGNVLWTRALAKPADAAYDNGHVFTVDSAGVMQAFAADTGATAWAEQLPGQYSFSSPPIAVNGVVYTGGAGSGGTMYAVRESDGAVLWSQSVMNGDSSSPAYDGSHVFVSYAGPQVYSFDAGTGAPAWHYSGCCEGGGGTTPVVNSGRLYVRDPTSSNYVLNTANGHVVDSFAADTPPTFADGLGLFRAGSVVRAQDASTGAGRWSFSGDGALDTPLVAAGAVAYVGSSQGNLYALNLASGQPVWSTNVGAPIYGANENGYGQAGLAAGEGLLVVPAANSLIAFSGAGGPSGSAAPQPTQPASVSQAPHYRSLKAALRHFRPILRRDARRLARAARNLKKTHDAKPLEAAITVMRADLGHFYTAVRAQHPKSHRLRQGRKLLMATLVLQRRGLAGLSRALKELAAHQRAPAARSLKRGQRSLARADVLGSRAARLILGRG